MEKRNILILGSGGNRAPISIIRSIYNENVNVFVALSKREKVYKYAYKNYVKEFFYFDDSNEKAFIKFLISINKVVGSYYIFALDDKKTGWLIKNQKTLNSIDVQFETPSYESFETMVFKPKFIKYVKDNGFKTPRELSYEEMKHELKSGKHVVLKANDKETLLKYKSPIILNKYKQLKKIDLLNNNFIFQEYINGPSVYYSAYYKKGLKISGFGQINLVQQPGGGSVLKAAPYEFDKDIVSKIDAMFFKLNWDGVMMIEFKIANKDYYAIECNPRYWGPNQLLIDNNLNYPQMMLNDGKYDFSKVTHNIGYKWINGYFLGLILKIRGKGKFQRHKYKFEYKINYKDLWNRKDTRFYFFFEVFLTIYLLVFSKIVNIFRIKKNS